jgi:hypothetical protein
VVMTSLNLTSWSAWIVISACIFWVPFCFLSKLCGWLWPRCNLDVVNLKHLHNRWQRRSHATHLDAVSILLKPMFSGIETSWHWQKHFSLGLYYLYYIVKDIDWSGISHLAKRPPKI